MEKWLVVLELSSGWQRKRVQLECLDLGKLDPWSRRWSEKREHRAGSALGFYLMQVVTGSFPVGWGPTSQSFETEIEIKELVQRE